MKKPRSIQVFLWLGAIFLLTLSVIIPLDTYISYLINENAIQIMIILMIAGIISLVKNHDTLIFASLMCAGLVALSLKSNTDNPVKMAKEEMLNSFYVASIYLGDLSDKKDGWSNKIAHYNPDIISFSNVDPEWAKLLTDSLSFKYNNYRIFERIDNHGLAIFSRYPIKEEGVIMADKIPMYSYLIKLPFHNNSIRVISGHFIEVSNNEGYEFYKSQLESIENYVQSSPKLPLVLVGALESSSWERNLFKLRKSLSLHGSRRNYIEANITKLGLLYMRIKKGDIFYNKQIECTSFEDLSLNRKTFGVMTNFQLKS